MKSYINEFGKPAFKDVKNESLFNIELFHKPNWQEDDGENFALHTNMGSLTVCDRMTGCGYRDIESGYRDKSGNFWLASGFCDVRYSGRITIGEAINWIKERANTFKPG